MTDNNAYVIVIEIIDNTDAENPKVSTINIYSPTAKESFAKLIQATEIYKKPSVDIRVIGTYKKVDFVVTAESLGEEIDG